MAMREKQFIKQNIADWEKLWHKANYPLLRKVSEHASFARTFYSNRKVSVYLNDLVVSSWLKKVELGTSRQKSQSFWLHELPLLVHEHRTPLRISFLIFLFAMVVGMISSAVEPSFMTSILGDDYVALTFENIRLGDPMKIYKQKNQIGMAAGITANNLYISLLVYVLGLIGGLGSIGLLISNGVLVGSFQYLFISEGVFRESLLTIWTHGLPEITAIVVSGGAGLTLGKGVITGNSEKFKKSAKDGFKILLGIVPILIFAGFAEGYLTRFTDAPDALRIGFIAVCLAFILIYFVWYPNVRSQWISNKVVHTGALDPSIRNRNEKEVLFQIRSAEEILKLSFRWIDSKVIIVLMACSLVFLVIIIGSAELGDMIFPNKILGTLSRIDQFFKNPVQWLILSFIHGFISIRFFEKQFERPRSRRNFWIFIFPVGFLAGMIMLNHAITPIVLIFLTPMSLVIANYWWLEGKWSTKGVLQTIKGQTLRLISLQLNLFLVAMILIAVFDTYFVQFTLNTLTGFLPDYINAATSISKGILTFTFLLLIYIVYSLMVIAMCWMTGTLIEIRDGRSLRIRINQWLPLLILVFGLTKGWTQSSDTNLNFDKTLWQKEKESLNYFEKEKPEEVGILNDFLEIFGTIPWEWVLYILSGLIVLYGVFRLILHNYFRELEEMQSTELLIEYSRPTHGVRKVWDWQELENFRKDKNWLALIRAYHAEILENNKVSVTTTNREFEEQFSNLGEKDLVAEINKIFEKGWYGKDSIVTREEWDIFYARYVRINKKRNES